MELLRLMEEGDHEVVGFGGARGGSKSHAVRAVNLIRRFKYADTNSLIFRKTFPELTQNHLLPLFRQWPQIRDWYNASSHILRFPNGSTTLFGSADDERGFARYQGSEFADIFLDEAEQIPEDNIIWMRTMLRCTTSKDIKLRMVLTANPGDVSHGYLKRVFLDKEYNTNERPDDYVFLQAHGYDNVEWARQALEEDGITVQDYYSWPSEKQFDYFIHRTQYGRNLSTLPGRLRDAHLLGDWSVFVGQFFSNFRPEKHVIDNRLFRREPWWPTWISMDWGFLDPTVLLWHTIDEEKRVTTYRELVVNGTTPENIGRLIAEATPSSEKPEAFYLSPDAFARRTSERSIAMEIGDVLHAYGLPAPQKADHERVSGWNLMYQMLDNGTWHITDNCRDLINSLPLMVADEKRVEDIADNAHDHSPDSARYGLFTHLRKPHVPTDEVMRRKITVTDPTQIHIQALALQAKMREMDRPLRFRRVR